MPNLKTLLKRGDWSPLLPPGPRMLLVVLPSLEAVSRGIDYVTGDKDGTTTTLTAVERAMPLQAWGVLCLVAGLTILSGFVMRWQWVAIVGLYIGGATYTSLTIGLIAKTFERGGDGFRTPVMFSVFAITFWGMAIGYAIQASEERSKKEALGWKE